MAQVIQRCCVPVVTLETKSWVCVLTVSFMNHIFCCFLKNCINVHVVCCMVCRPEEEKHLLLIWTEKKTTTVETERKCIFEIFIWGRHLITGWRWYISVAHRKKIIFQRKAKPYCWECTIWISKRSAPTSIFCGITQESAQGGKTDWWWIMYTFSKLWYLSANVMLHVTYPNHQCKTWQMIIFRKCPYIIYYFFWYLRKCFFSVSLHAL